MSSSTDISFCNWDNHDCSSNISYCCPKPLVCLGDCAYCCEKSKLQYINRGTIRCEQPIPTRFNGPYYFVQSNPNNCCHGSWSGLYSPGQFITKASRGGGLGDISYPRNQLGRWNLSTTNTKLFPVISKGRKAPAHNVQYPLTTVKQSRRLFQNTNPNMSKKQTFSYLVRNRRYLNR